MTDPISAMLSMIKNAGRAGRPVVSLPYSKLKHAIADCLSREGFVGNVAKANSTKGASLLEIVILYNADKSPRIYDIKRMSKPSRRLYVGSKKIRGGHITTILSTPKGIMTSREAKKGMVGGEVLFTIE